MIFRSRRSNPPHQEHQNTQSTKTYDVFGTKASDIGITEVSQTLSTALGVPFEAHDSYFINGLYFLHKGSTHGRVRVLNNVNEDPDELPYLEYAEYPIIVSVDEPVDADSTAATIIGAGFEHLRRNTLNSTPEN